MIMKEKFSELYHLAWNYSEFDDEYKENPTYERRCVVQSKIFAELIVGECASIADEPTSQPFDSYGKKIKQHFGVEE